MKHCECGCGLTIEPKRCHKYGGGGRFRPGHANRGKRFGLRKIPPLENIPSGLCECGCGNATNISNETCPNKRRFRGYPMPRLPGHATRTQAGQSHRWKGGRISNRGYVLLYMPDDPRSNGKGYYPEHRLVWEEANGILGPGMHVHHINGIKDDNRLENLIALTVAEHSREHGSERMAIATRRNPGMASRGGRKGAEARWGSQS